MPVRPQPFRQIHLDFHTSEDIPAVAARFDAEEFAKTLERARVNSIQCFARCWHGWMYYDSQKFPDLVHPTLARRDLLPAQIAACHKRGIKVPIYVAVQVDRANAFRHPEWVQLSPAGNLGNRAVYEPGLGPALCLNTPFRDFLFEHIRELFAMMPVDGFWFDGVGPQDCSCRFCIEAMLRQGLDPSREEVRQEFGLGVLNRFMAEMFALVREHSQDATIFFNSGHIGTRHRAVADLHTHFEIESLPSGGWGYLHFPVATRYARTLGRETVGMTGKFHTSWGDFHSFKNRAALEFECFHMLALGAACSVGDQLHPDGQIDPHTYDLIGAVYEQVEAREPWCREAVPVSEVAVVTPERDLPSRSQDLPAAIFGATRMLQELAIQFDIIDREADLSRYAVVVLPDEVQVAPPFTHRLHKYLQEGGAVIATARSGLDEAQHFALEAFGVEHVGEAEFSPEYIVPEEEIGAGMPLTEHVIYKRGQQIRALEGTQVLAATREPYFNRTWRHFCSHKQAPSTGQVGYPAITRRDRAMYFAHPIFTQYHKNAPLFCKRLLANALALLLPEPLLRHDGPSTVIATLNEQPHEARLIVHLLHYIAERRGADFDTIEDIIPLHDLRVSVRVERALSHITLVPQNTPLPFEMEGSGASFVLPRLDGHQMVEIGFKKEPTHG